MEMKRKQDESLRKRSAKWMKRNEGKSEKRKSARTKLNRRCQRISRRKEQSKWKTSTESDVAKRKSQRSEMHGWRKRIPISSRCSKTTILKRKSCTKGDWKLKSERT